MSAPAQSGGPPPASRSRLHHRFGFGDLVVARVRVISSLRRGGAAAPLSMRLAVVGDQPGVWPHARIVAVERSFPPAFHHRAGGFVAGRSPTVFLEPSAIVKSAARRL